MYAVIELKGTQVLVEKGSLISVNRMKEEKGDTVKVSNVLFGKKGAVYHIGEPYVKGAYVECEVVRDKRSKKVIAFKYRDRKSSQSTRGHRQDLTELKVKEIHFEGKAEASDEKPKKKAEKSKKDDK